MQRPAEHRDEQAREALRLLVKYRHDSTMGCSVGQLTWEHEKTVVSVWRKCYTDEIFEALVADPVGCMFSNLCIIVEHKSGTARWAGDLRVVDVCVGRAIRERLNNKQANPATLVKTTVANELAERRDEGIKRLRSRNPEELLPDLLETRGRNPLIAAVLADHLAVSQRSDLKVLLHDQLSDKPVIYLRMDREPEESRWWLFWYLYHSEMAQPNTKRVMGGISRDVLAIRRGAVPTSKTGEPIFPLGPMYAHLYKALGPELRKWGYHIKHPESVNRIARAFNVSHATVTKWLEEDVPVKIQPSGKKSGVHCDFTLDTVVRCMEILKGEKPGPKSRRS
jgi:hypothetical protein